MFQLVIDCPGRAKIRLMYEKQPSLSLLPHPATPAAVVSSLVAEVEIRPDGGVVFFYCLRGDMARLRIPPEQRSERTDLLWEHTCFEAFVGLRGETAYREFNFSPSGQWAIFTFSDYRQRVEELPGKPHLPPPRIITRRTDGRLELEAHVELNCLLSNPAKLDWEIGLTAVIETNDTIDGSHSYWALKHPTPRPDFHHRETFSLHLAA